MGIAQTGLGRDLEILEAIASASPQGMRVTDLATSTGRDKSQISRAVGRLLDAGLLVRQTDSSRFNLGPRLFAMARYTFEAQLVSMARPEMQSLVHQLGETVHLTVLQGTDVVTIHSESPAHGFRALSWTGVTAPCYLTSSGRVLLSAMSDAQIFALFPDEQPFGEVPKKCQVKNVQDLVGVVRAIREVGYAKVIEEFEQGLVGASVGVRDFSGDVIAALNVAAPKVRFEDQLDLAVKRMSVSSTNISNLMGARIRH
jgi:DNA-binding IclR family transcriptional regulator